jgi:hypothetical protein
MDRSRWVVKFWNGIWQDLFYINAAEDPPAVLDTFA